MPHTRRVSLQTDLAETSTTIRNCHRQSDPEKTTAETLFHRQC